MKPCHIFVEKFLICYELVCSVSVLSLLRQYSNCPRINKSSHELRVQAAVGSLLMDIYIGQQKK